MKIKVFRIEEEFKGDSYSLSPRVPTNIQNGEDSIYQPNENEVPDAFKTGELWVLNDVEFKLEKIYKVRLFIAGINVYYIYSSDVEEYIKENGYIINSIDGFKYCTR